ncbi:MAG: UDP-3-O-(3-hydroxymyristoyl)glucosamine N-acyltransferase, partial [Gammaproteobacteria bacterium]|nr:UDP-3-O-(3-hydroxymyristoyl)glucosamine N-acyltransferase [Gammaproteobacteria bacterium]
MYSLAELADRLDLTFSGDAQRTISGLASLADAGPDELAFLADKKYLPQLASTRAGAVILHTDFVEQCPTACLICSSPYLYFARASRLLDPAPASQPGVHPAAVVSDRARVHASASVGPNAVIEAGAVLAADVVVGAGVYLGHDSHLGVGTRVYPNAVIYHDVQVGEH